MEKEDLISTNSREKEMNPVKYDKNPNGVMDITGKICYNDTERWES